MLFPEFGNIVSILNYNLIEFITLLYVFLSNLLCTVQKYMNWWISLTRFQMYYLLFTWASDTDSLWRICSEVNILSPFPPVVFDGNIPLLSYFSTIINTIYTFKSI